MIKLSDYNRLYRHTFDWVLSRIESDTLKFYGDKVEDWIEALRAFEKVEKELFKDYSVKYSSGSKFKRGCVKGLELTADQLFNLFHKHINQYGNYTVRYFIFHWWNDLRYFVEGAQPALDCPWELYKPATKEEIEQANKEFAHYDFGSPIEVSDHTFDKGIILEYRGIRFPVDDQWGDAWFKKKNGEITHFQLVWDWWFPIDECLDLYNI